MNYWANNHIMGTCLKKNSECQKIMSSGKISLALFPLYTPGDEEDPKQPVMLFLFLLTHSWTKTECKPPSSTSVYLLYAYKFSFYWLIHWLCYMKGYVSAVPTRHGSSPAARTSTVTGPQHPLLGGSCCAPGWCLRKGTGDGLGVLVQPPI